MRADQIIMLGVAGAGLFAGYQLLKPKEDDTPPITEDNLLLLSDPLSFVQGQLYQGRLELPTPAQQPVPPFNTAGSTSELRSALEMLGFQEVKIYNTAGELPRTWPRPEPPGPSSRWFQARWRAPSMTLPRPDALPAVWTFLRTS